MSGPVQILTIHPGSDGDGRKWPKHHYTRNDQYFLERVGQLWQADLPEGTQPGVAYRLDRLPQGYAGFEKARPDSKHIDRYVYGHPHGQFRSIAEFYPHFKHLMDYGGPMGCECKLCANGFGVKAKSGSGSSRDVSESRPVRQRAPPKKAPGMVSSFSRRSDPAEKAAGLSNVDAALPQKRKLADLEGVPDVYEAMVAKLKDAGLDALVDEPIEEPMSPGWRTSNVASTESLREWKSLPRYVPRLGEVVMFTRKFKDGKKIACNSADGDFSSFSLLDTNMGGTLDRVEWEAGVVTQMPKEPILDQDLVDDSEKTFSVNESGFRIEPMPGLGNERKPYGTQYTYVSLHSIRPVSLWSECLTGSGGIRNCHPTVQHALTVASSFCVVGRYRFKGRWPALTIFARGVYIGAEFLMPGDTVRLLPRKEDPQDRISDVMVITSIRLLLVNLDIEEHGILVPGPTIPYQVCLHLSGRVFTLDPSRAFNGVSSRPIDPESGVLPAVLARYGPWYHYTDPAEPNQRIELPYHRILGRCFEDAALNAWFGTKPESQTAGGNRFGQRQVKTEINRDLTRGLRSIESARAFSMKSDPRIMEGNSWFWADTRIEQLALHEVNGWAVGEKDMTRTKSQLQAWRTSLRFMGGKKDAVEAFKSVQTQRTAEESSKLQSSYGMVAAAAQPDPATEGTSEEEGEGSTDAAMIDTDGAEAAGEGSEVEQMDGMKLDESQSVSRSTKGMMSSFQRGGGSLSQAIALTDDEDSEDAAENKLAEKLARNIRPNDPRRDRSWL